MSLSSLGKQNADFFYTIIYRQCSKLFLLYKPKLNTSKGLRAGKWITMMSPQKNYPAIKREQLLRYVAMWRNHTDMSSERSQTQDILLDSLIYSDRKQVVVT